MIKSYRSKALKAYAEKGKAQKLPVQNARRVAEILAALNAAERAGDMNLPGYKFHSLAPGQPGRYSVWVTGNYRVSFAFDGAHAVDVDIEDYH